MAKTCWLEKNFNKKKMKLPKDILIPKVLWISSKVSGRSFSEGSMAFVKHWSLFHCPWLWILPSRPRHTPSAIFVRVLPGPRDLCQSALKSINHYTKQGDIIVISIILMRTECENYDVDNIIPGWEKHVSLLKDNWENIDRIQSTCKTIY